MSIYVYEHKKWPEFHWDRERIAFRLAEVRHRQGQLSGRMEGLPVDLQNEAMLHTVTLDVLTSGEIDNELLDPVSVRSSVARRLGMDVTNHAPADRYIEGIVEMTMDATQQCNIPLTRERLFGWHAALLSKRPSMPDAAGASGKEKIHFQAPHSHTFATEIRRYLDWFNTADRHPVIKAAIAHWWFIAIHPFAYGNGRIARIITEMQLSRADGDVRRFYSLSAQIRSDRQGYGEWIAKTREESVDITSWIEWFLDCLERSILNTDETLAVVKRKARFWEKFPATSFTDRQRMMLNKMLDGFTGKLTSSQWAMATKTSQDSAGRDINDLLQRGILVKQPGGGRSTGYLLAAL